MNKQGPISRIKRVQVKCKKCGKYKDNVIYRDINDDKEAFDVTERHEKPKIEKEVAEKVKVSSKKTTTHYIKDIISHQKEVAAKYGMQ